MIRKQVMNFKMIKRISSFLPPVIVESIIFLFSGQNGEESGNFSGGISTKIAGVLLKIFGSGMNEAERTEFTEKLESLIREMGHAGEHALLMLAFYITVSVSVKKDKDISLLGRLIPAFALTVVFAVLDEIHQSFVPGRACEVQDVLVDAFGALVMGLLISLFYLSSRK